MSPLFSVFSFANRERFQYKDGSISGAGFDGTNDISTSSWTTRFETVMRIHYGSKNQSLYMKPDRILLSPNLDGLFDRYLISFKDSGRIIISNRINTNDLNRLGINQNMKLTQITDGMKPYLSRHRKIFNDKN